MVDFIDGTKAMSMFWEYLAMLPDNGKFHSAVSGDEEYAQALADSLSEEELADMAKPPEGGGSPSLEGYGRTNAQLDDLQDTIEALRLSVVSMFSKKKPPKQKPAKRPETAVQKAVKRRIWEYERQEAKGSMSSFGF